MEGNLPWTERGLEQKIGLFFFFSGGVYLSPLVKIHPTRKGGCAPISGEGKVSITFPSPRLQLRDVE